MHTESAPARVTESAPAGDVVARSGKSVSGRAMLGEIALTYVLVGLALFTMWKALAIVF